MSTPNPVSLTIDKQTIESVLQANIQAAIVAQFATTPELLGKIVTHLLEQKVDSRGEPCNWGSPLMEYLTKDAIRKIAEQAVREFVEEKKPEMIAEVKRQLRSKKLGMVDKFVAAAEAAMSPNFYVRCDLNFENKE